MKKNESVESIRSGFETKSSSCSTPSVEEHLYACEIESLLWDLF